MEIYRACTTGGGVDASDATATAADIVSPKTAYTADGKVTGLIGTDIFTINQNMVAVSFWDIMNAIINTENSLEGFNGSLNDLPDAPSEQTYRLNILLSNEPNITGDISNIPDGNYDAIWINSSNITGDFSTLPSVYAAINFIGCSLLSGVFFPTATIFCIYLTGTAMSSSDIDQTIINLAAITEVIDDGCITIPTGRTSESDAAVSTLTGLGWYIQEGE